MFKKMRLVIFLDIFFNPMTTSFANVTTVSFIIF